MSDPKTGTWHGQHPSLHQTTSTDTDPMNEEQAGYETDAEHTPGPWDSSPQKGEPGNCFQAQVWGSEGEDLAQLAPSIPPEVATANARLIAAAPELLEACRAVVEGVDDDGYPDVSRLVDAAREAEDAIAKAEGRDQ